MFTKNYIRYNLNTGETIVDLPADTLNSGKMMFISVSSAMKLGYATLDETNMIFNNRDVVAIQGIVLERTNEILFEITTLKNE